ncbi:MAG: hypothetical protein U0176_20735 [Bacteroidia bacterium]
MNENSVLIKYSEGSPRTFLEVGSKDPALRIFIQFISIIVATSSRANLQRLASGIGGNNIYEYCSYHFSSEPELGVYVREGYLMISDYMESIEIPKALFWAVLEHSISIDDREIHAQIQNQQVGLEFQGKISFQEERYSTLVTYDSNPGWEVPAPRPHLLDVLDKAARALLGGEQFDFQWNESKNPRVWFIEAMKIHGFWGKKMPIHIQICCREGRYRQLAQLSESYAFLLRSITRNESSNDIPSILERTPLAIDFYARSIGWVGDEFELIRLGDACIEEWNKRPFTVPGDYFLSLEEFDEVAITVREIALFRFGISMAQPG